jgi:hypothetical protein
MERNTAVLTTYAAFIVDGNLITNLLSIGGPTPLTGPQPPRPATAGGLATHGVFEGDTSMTRRESRLLRLFPSAAHSSAFQRMHTWETIRTSMKGFSKT